MITMYSADWCGDCRRSKRLLNELNVPYTMVDVDADESAAEKVIEINGGMRSIPVIVFSQPRPSVTFTEYKPAFRFDASTVFKVASWLHVKV